MAKLRLLAWVMLCSSFILFSLVLNYYTVKDDQVKNGDLPQFDYRHVKDTGTSRETTFDRRKQWRILVEQSEEKKKFSRLPDIIGIGVRKCGTGMLQSFIMNHPLIRGNGREVHYYDELIKMGINHYKTLLPTATEDQLIMEKTPAYFTTLPTNLPEIILHDSPKAKLLLILCDPVRRAFSDYVMRGMHGSVKAANKTFEEYTQIYLKTVRKLFANLTMQDDDDKLEYVLRSLRKDRCTFSFGHGIYAYFIRRWMRVFSPDRIMVINGEQFLINPGAVVESVQEFLGIPKLLTESDFVPHHKTGLFCVRPWWNETNGVEERLLSSNDVTNNLLCSSESKGLTRSQNSKYTLKRETEEELRKFYRPYNEILYNMLGRKFDW